MQKLFKKISVLFIIGIFLFSSIGVRGEAPLVESPPPAPVHNTPVPTQEPPAVIDATQSSSALSSVRFRLDAKFFHIWFPAILNADEAVLLWNGQVYVIDCGDKAAALKGAQLLNALGITKIDKLFNTHPHHDHLQGLKFTDEAAHVQELLFCFPHDSTKHIIEAIEYANEKGITVSDYADGDTFTMGDGEVTLKFYCLNDPDLDMNSNSAVTMVQFGNRRILFTADMEKPGQEVLLSRVPAEDLRADILKYPHHGRSALLDTFYAAVSPSAAIVTNTDVSWFGVKYLTGLKIPTFFTREKNACIHLYTDGSVWVIERVPLSKITPIN